MDEVSGSVDYDPGGQLPSGSQLIVELRDTSLQDVSSVLIARKVIDLNSGPPHSFRLEYNPRSVGEKNTYSLQAGVETADGQLLFVNDTAHNVITRGNPSRVNMDLVPTDLARSLIVDDQSPEVQPNPAEDEPGLIETVPVDSRNDPLTTTEEPPAESGGGGGIAFFIILLVAVGFIVVLVARHRATKSPEETDEDDFIDDGQDQPDL